MGPSRLLRVFIVRPCGIRSTRRTLTRVQVNSQRMSPQRRQQIRPELKNSELIL